MALWTQPVDSRDDAEVAFREVYADPAVVNGTEMTIAELAPRARSRQRAFGQLGGAGRPGLAATSAALLADLALDPA